VPLGSCETITVVYPPEVIEQYGDTKDWRNLVGTGPYELTEVVEGRSLTWTKNPEYWGYDEKYPQNRLPYADEITALIMPELATRLAALRSGRIDLLGSIGQTQITSIDQVVSLTKTDPDLEIWPYKSRSNHDFFFVGVNRPPWNDDRVRQAMQMALDVETIKETYFHGYGDTTPNEHIANNVPGIGTPFEEWPEAVKKIYRYDPEGAEALLDAAGYKRGADGIRFKTRMAYFERFDANFAELAAGYWRKIGVEVGVDVMDFPTLSKVTPDQDTWRLRDGQAAFRYDHLNNLKQFHTDLTAKAWNRTGLRDPKFDALIEAAEAATTMEEQERFLKEANTLLTARQMRIYGLELPSFQAWQPWLKGYNGEISIAQFGGFANILTRLWVDQELKKEMGF
jgi:peptide/nickel transport system substrate-binding protein